EVDAVGGGSSGQTDRKSRPEDIAFHCHLSATPEKPADAQGDRPDPRYRTARNSFQRYGDPMTQTHDYDSIPGTYVYDSERGRIGYALNMFCMSLNRAENRQRFKENAAAYLDGF